MSTIVTINSSDQISSSRANLNTNFSNLNTDKMETSVLDTDAALAANSDAKVPSQKAVKAYVDAGGHGYTTTSAGAADSGKLMGLDSVGKVGTTFLKRFGVRAKQNAGVSVGTSLTVVPFQAEDFDDDTMHDNTTNNSRITFNTAGYYLVGACLWIANSGSTGNLGAEIKLNGSTAIAGGGGVGGSTAGGGVSLSTIRHFAVNDYIEFFVCAPSGAVTSTGDEGTNFFAQLLMTG